MEPKDQKRRLGRGLSALMADVDTGETTGSVAQVKPADRSAPIENIHPNPDQPRRTFTEDALADLAQSIQERGVLQPLIVRAHPAKSGEFEIVAGERRWRAAQRAGVHELPIIVRDFTDTEVLEVAIVENVQRADLNPVEEAAGYKMLMERFGHTQDQVAKALGKSRSHIANLLRLLNLPEPLQAHVRDGELSMGHARALLTADNPVSLAKEVIAKGLSVRETERKAKDTGSDRAAPRKSASAKKDSDTIALERDLSAQLQMPVSISHDPQTGKGKLVVTYGDLSQLDALCQYLSGHHH